MRKQALFATLLTLFPALTNAQEPGTTGRSDIVFVCEHGSAKSVVAAAHFNRLAALRGLPLRAVARGTSPDEVMAPAALTGLRQDQLEPPDARPVRLTRADIERARKIIAFSELPDEFDRTRGVEIWSVPPVSVDYVASRDAMIRRLEGLLDELAAGPD